MESNWDCEKDLELVKQKLSTCSPSQKHKIQRLLAEILEAPILAVADDLEPRNLISTPEDSLEDTRSPLQSVPLTPECLDLDPSLILNVTRLMHQFKKDFQGTRKLLEDKAIENRVTWNLFQTTNCTQLNNLWNVFSVYIQKTVGSNEATGPQPKCPLNVDVILEQIFGYLPTKDLLNCRLVSRAWNEKLTQWELPKRQNWTLTLSFDRIVPIMESQITSPFIFTNLTVQLGGIATDKCTWFFTNYGPYVKSLRLYMGNPIKTPKKSESSRTSSMFEFMYNLRTIFQNVNQMQDLRIISIPEAVLLQPFVFTPQELNTFDLPTVRTLTLALTCDFSTQFSEGFFNMLHNVKTLNLLIKKPTNELQQVLDGIKKLSLSSLTLGCGTNSRANLWASLQIQNLKKLRTDTFFESDEDVASFQEFVKSQCHSFETFTCTNLQLNQTIWTAPISIMQKLETLRFEFSGRCPFNPCTPQQLPRVRSATFRFSEVSKYFSNDSFDTVLELNNCRKRAGLSAADWKALGFRFPNVKRLSVNLGDEFSMGADSEVFRCFPNMEYLSLGVNIEENYEINVLLSGFTPKKVPVMSQLLATLKSTEELMKIEPEHASLRDMKKLKELRLKLSGGSGDAVICSVIDNVGIQLGLMSIQTLEKLSIFGNFTISEDGAALLKNYHRNVLLSPKIP